MASHAADISAVSIADQRPQVDRLLARRALFVTSFAAFGFATVTFIAIQLAVRAQITAGVIRSLRESQLSLERAYASQLSVGQAPARVDRARLTAMSEIFGPVALVHRGQIILSTLPSELAAPISAAPSECLSLGCELRANSQGFLVMPVGCVAAAGIGPDDQLVVVRSIDATVDQFTGNIRLRLPSLAAAVIFLALLLAAFVFRALSRPMRLLIARLEQSQAAGRWDADFPEDSPSREVNLLAAAINRAALAVNHSHERLDQISLEFVETMAQALDARDPCTAGHSQRVSGYATAIAATMGLSTDEMETIRLGARLHDIGKIGISDTLLQKTSHLTRAEYDIIKQHPQIGRRILEKVAAFERFLPLVELHHEDFDGRGYPYGLQGSQIPLAVRIVRVADVFDALTTDRSYRSGMPIDHAYKVIESRAGTQFDPDVVNALRMTLGELLHAGLAGLPLLAEVPCTGEQRTA